MPIIWTKEARDINPDPITGATLGRLTGGVVRTHNIYCDAPRATRDGKRFAALRYMDALLSKTQALLCVDMETKWTGLIDSELTTYPIGPPWGGSVYYHRGTVLYRACLESGDTAPLLDMKDLPHCWQLMSISHDERYLLYTGVKQEDPELHNIVRLDLRDFSWKWLLQESHEHRLGAAFIPDTYEIVLARCYWENNTRYGAAFLVDSEGEEKGMLYRHVHHSCALGNTGYHAALHAYDYENLRHLPEYPDGELYIYGAPGTEPRLIPAPEHIFYHISSSPCGRYVVTESFANGLEGAVPIVVINVETGKYRDLVTDCKCSGGGNDDRQAKPYFTHDMRHVIYTADPDGAINVWAAGIPAGFLESLD